MTKQQRYRYEMFVRVRDYGTTNRDRFPETSTAGEMFAEVASAVAAIEDNMKGRVVARAEAQKVKRATREAVFEYMKALTRTARRVAMDESDANRFKMPTRHSVGAVLSTARAFIQEAEPRQAEFIRFGLPSSFISDFRMLVDNLEDAVQVQLNSRTQRHRTQGGIETALVHGITAIHTLDVVVANELRDDPVRSAARTGARRIQGLTHASGTHAGPTPLAVVPGPASGEVAKAS